MDLLWRVSVRSFAVFAGAAWTMKTSAAVLLSLFAFHCGAYADAGVDGDIVFHENFESAASVDGRWDLKGGGWDVSGNQLTSRFELGVASAATMKEGSGHSGYAIDFDVRRNNGDSKDSHCGVHLADGNYVFIRENAVCHLGPESNGEQGVRPQQGFPRGEWFHVRVICGERETTASVNGRIVFSIPRATDKSKLAKISLSAWQMSASFKNFRITKLPGDGRPGVASVKNLVPNSGFEFISQERLPDYWGTPNWGIGNVKWFSDFQAWRTLWGAVDEGAYDGRRAFLLCCPDRGRHPGLLRSCELNVSPKKRYVVSAYMRCEPEGVEATLAGSSLKLTGKWLRYSAPFICRDKASYSRMLDIDIKTCGKVWVDDVQVEEGVEPTPYLPSETDVLLAGGGQGRKASGPPHVEPVKIAEAPVLDGRLDDPCWQKAAKLPFSLLGGGEPAERTEARVLYGDSGIYIGFECQEKGIGSVRCKAVAENGYVWTDPCVNVFLAPESSLSRYCHFAVNCDGALYSSAKFDSNWHAFWSARTCKGDNSWTAELFIPFGNFQIGALAPEKWRINLTRDNNRGHEAGTWAAMSGSFHKPDLFGVMTLPRFDAGMYNVDISGLEFRYGRDLSPFVKFDLTNRTGSDASFKAVIEVEGVKGRKSKAEIAVQARAGERTAVRADDLNIKEFEGAGSCRISLFDSKTGVLVKNCFKPALVIPRMVDAVLQNSYYTTERDAFLKLTGNVADSEGMDVCVSVMDGSRKVYGKRISGVPSQVDVALPLQELPVGEHEVLVQLVMRSDAEGKAVAGLSLPLRKLAKPDCDVKIDHFRRCLAVDGKPYFPFSVFCEGSPSIELVDAMKAAGFKTMFIHIPNKGGDMKGILEHGNEVGLKMICELDSYNFEKFDRITWDRHVKSTMETMRKYRDFPAVLAWDVMDEKGGLGVMDENPEALSAFLSYPRILKEADPCRPIYTNEYQAGLYRMVERRQGWPSDIASVDYYPMDGAINGSVYGSEPVPFRYRHEDVLYTSKIVKLTHDVGGIGDKPVFVFLQSCGYAFFSAREPFPQEEEFMTYAALINGASGICYFASHPRSNALWEKIKALNLEVRELAPAILSMSPAPEVESSSDKIQLLVRRHGADVYLIAVNSSDVPVDARFDLSALRLTKRTMSKVLFEDRNAEVKDNIIADRFMGYQRHVYVIPVAERPFMHSLLFWLNDEDAGE